MASYRPRRRLLRVFIELGGMAAVVIAFWAVLWTCLVWSGWLSRQ